MSRANGTSAVVRNRHYGQTMTSASQEAARITGSSVIYLDNNASTEPDPLVVQAVNDASIRLFANPSSTHHGPGHLAASAIYAAREEVAGLMGVRPSEVIFTSGATESDNLAIKAVWAGRQATDPRRNRLVIGATEHPAVLNAALALAPAGAEVVLAPVDPSGRIDVESLAGLVDERTLFVSIMAANNETGTVNALGDIAACAHAVGAFVHTDATQLVGRLPFSMDDLDLVSVSGHKMHGPKGVGALICRRNVPLGRLFDGGDQERGRRAGTLNTPGIVGFGVAARLATERLSESTAIAGVRDYLHSRIEASTGDVVLNGHETNRLPNTLNLRFRGADAEALMAAMPSVVCSAGSACHSGAPGPSHVLLAMGLTREEAQQSLRFSTSRTTTREDADRAAAAIAEAVAYVRTAVTVHG